MVMKRRTFIWLSIVGTTAIVIPFATKSLTTSTKDILATPSSLSLLFGAEQIKKIGIIYKELRPNETTKNILIKNLLNGNDKLLLEKSNIEKIETVLWENISFDFKNNHTLILDGWVVSRTEARQCALFSILNA